MNRACFDRTGDTPHLHQSLPVKCKIRNELQPQLGFTHSLPICARRKGENITRLKEFSMTLSGYRRGTIMPPPNCRDTSHASQCKCMRDEELLRWRKGPRGWAYFSPKFRFELLVRERPGRMPASRISNRLRHNETSGYRCMIPRRMAIATACVRSVAPSFSMMCFMWTFTVSTAIKSLSAMS